MYLTIDELARQLDLSAVRTDVTRAEVCELAQLRGSTTACVRLFSLAMFPS